MKKFKQADLSINIVLILGLAIYCLLAPELDRFIYSYLIVGSWQVTSMLVHLFNRCFTYQGSKRFVYNFITLISLVTMPLGFFWILTICAPFMAIYYTFICYDELFVKMQRPLAVLK